MVGKFCVLVICNKRGQTRFKNENKRQLSSSEPLLLSQGT